MPAKFDFLSPGVILREIDQSQIPAATTQDGILIIGTAPSGPALKPVRVRNLENFLEVFGNPTSGRGQSDVWRNPSFGPSYGMYAAQAWLSSESSPVTFVRLLGEQHPSHSAGSGLEAGWGVENGIHATDRAQNGGAYGLFVGPSGSTKTYNETRPATLAAIIYVDQGELRLKGTLYAPTIASPSTTSSAGEVIQSLNNSTAAEFEIEHVSSTNVTESFVFNFDKSASNTNSNFIRSVFPTNPEKTNAKIFGSTNDLFLGETFEEAVSTMMQNNQKTAKNQQFGVLVHLGRANTTGWAKWEDHRRDAIAPKSGWFVSQDLGLATAFNVTTQQKLFRLVGLHDGEWLQRNYQIGIEISTIGNNVNPYGAFHVYIMDLEENMVEQFRNLNFDPGSENYIAKRIGDQRQIWDTDQKKYRVEGEYSNNSSYVYVELSEAVKNGSLNSLAAVPFGVQGPVTFGSFFAVSGGSEPISSDAGGSSKWTYADSLGHKDDNLVGGSNTPAAKPFAFYVAGAKAKFEFPKLRLTTTSSKGSQNTDYATSDFLGVNHHLSGSRAFDQSYFDLVRQGSKNGNASMEVNLDETGSPGTDKEFQYFFSLDDVRYDTATGLCYYQSGSRAAENSVTGLASNGGIDVLINTRRIRKFKSPLFGGFDGVNIKEANPFANHDGALGSTSNLETNNYTIYSVMKALETVSDSEIVAYDLLSVPGVTRTKITDKVLEICADRSDALGIIDIESGFQPANVEATASVLGSVSGTVNSLVGRDINTSYGAAYYPWIRLRDTIGGNNDVIMAPPSVAAIGAIARSEAVSEPWFAPAGFNRGGIRQLGGPRGPQVVGTWEHLTKDNRDDLYQANINPIARFPAINEIVIFGQKTLQQTPSALDRINVRRLMIFLKKAIKNIADTILFDQNVNTTWLRFRAEADRVLSSVQTRLGLTEYKVVLDETTTTPDYIDRNILYAKIFVKPARAIEFIAVDFIITRTGVEF